MILRSVSSDISIFKTVSFHDGLNLVIADKEDKSGDGRSRNGAGKSSLIELINTLLGSDLKKDSLMKSEALKESIFNLSLSINGHNLKIARTGTSPSKIIVLEDVDNVLPVTIEDGVKYISNEQWLEYLGKQVFGINFLSKELKHSISFRMLFSYFARSGKGFDVPEKTFPQQARWQFQVALTYLLKLNWKLVRQFEAIRQKDKLIKALIKASNEGALKGVIGTASELTTEIHLKNARVVKLKQTVTDFKVLPEYQDKEKRATEITQELALLSVDDLSDKEWLANLERTVLEETEPDNSKVERLFKQTNSDFPELVSKKFEEFQAFHSSIVSNRKIHLAEEIDSIKERILIRDNSKRILDIERSEILNILRSHGALEQFYLFQGELNKFEAQVELLKQKLEATKNLAVQKTDLKIDKSKLQKKVMVDHTERDKAIEEAVVEFAKISEALYDESGRFTIEPTDDGPKFEFDIPDKKSTGKSKMQIFCFDMMMMKLWANEEFRPKVLIHDSILFDGVDERQVSKALYFGAKWAKQYNFQYIVTMNSDDLPDMSSFQDFNIKAHLVDLKITDSENGGLFGFRF
jgi:uncharacterized protein YydD (DUF2326 family)